MKALIFFSDRSIMYLSGKTLHFRIPMRKYALLLLPFIAYAALSQAVPSTLPTTAPTADIELGQLFESRVAGIQFQPPAGGTLVRQIEGGDLVRFVYPEKNWDLKVRVVHLAKPVPLSFIPTPNLSGGLLEMTVADLKTRDPSADVLLQEVKDFPPYQAGMLAARCNAGVDRGLVQEAIFKSDDQTFYTLQLTTPARSRDQKGDDDDPGEVLAAATFEKMLGTVKLIDRQQLKQEQDQRLIRTRGLFAIWDEKKLRSILIPDQYLRVVRDGKDAGYVQVSEHVANHAGNDGVEIVLRSQMTLEPAAPVVPSTPAPPAPTGIVVPTAAPVAPPIAEPLPIKSIRQTTMFVTFDRWHEDWSIITTFDNGHGPPAMSSELGNSDMQLRRILDREKAAAMWKEPGKHDQQPPVIEKQKYTLSVSQYTKTQAGSPVVRELPVFYLPQALGQLLPRLLPLNDSQTYMFASYVNNQREVMARYVDVMPEQEVDLEGQKVQAVPVRDRIGVEGAGTTHYLTRQGQWLGSVSDDRKLMVLPTDADSIRKIWKDAQLDEPPAAAQVR
jgi:hypothetical protein